ncbi:unnamed protein product, partial [Prorocentrum cordatum]
DALPGVAALPAGAGHGRRGAAPAGRRGCRGAGRPAGRGAAGALHAFQARPGRVE